MIRLDYWAFCHFLQFCPWGCLTLFTWGLAHRWGCWRAMDYLEAERSFSSICKEEKQGRGCVTWVMGIKERKLFDSWWDLRIWGLGFPGRVELGRWSDSKWKGKGAQAWETAGPGLPGTVLVASVVLAVINNSSSCSLKCPGLGHQYMVTLRQAAVHARAAVGLSGPLQRRKTLPSSWDLLSDAAGRIPQTHLRP